MVRFKPLVFRSSVIWASPASLDFFGEKLVISVPPRITHPFSTFLNPVIASINSLWPFPSIPAIPTISPALTSIETPRILDISFSPDVHKSLTSRTTSPISAFSFLISRKTSLPIIILAKSEGDVSCLSTVPIKHPCLITVIRSDISITSLSL